MTPPPPGPPIPHSAAAVLEYELTHDDLVDTSLAVAQRSRSARILRGGTFAAMSAVLLGGGLVVGVDGGGLVTALLGIAAFGLFERLILPRIQREQASAMLREGRNLFLGRQRLILDGEGITASNRVMDTRVRWAGVERIVPTERHVILYYGAARGLVVPRRVFASDAAVREFIEAAARLQQTALAPLPGTSPVLPPVR